MNICLMEKKKYSTIVSTLNAMLKNEGIKETMIHYLYDEKKEKLKATSKEVNSLVPDV